jgi:hypothetical protein
MPILMGSHGTNEKTVPVLPVVVARVSGVAMLNRGAVAVPLLSLFCASIFRLILHALTSLTRVSFSCSSLFFLSDYTTLDKTLYIIFIMWAQLAKSAIKGTAITVGRCYRLVLSGTVRGKGSPSSSLYSLSGKVCRGRSSSGYSRLGTRCGKKENSRSYLGK